MVEQLNPEAFTGAHPTAVEFVARLGAWGFRERPSTGRRGREVHQVFRGPHGGTLRVLRSRMGRADPEVVAKAARLVRVDVRGFWAGPGATLDSPTSTTPEAGTLTAAQLNLPSEDQDASPTEPSPQPQQPQTAQQPQQPQTAPQPERVAEGGGRRRACAGPSRDQITSMVLAAHTSTDRPLGFDQVVQLCHGRITRDQVRTASAALCRDGHLDRIRSAVYQWSGGHRATVVPPTTPTTPTAVPAVPVPSMRRAHPLGDSLGDAGPRIARSSGQTVTPSAADLFELLFPSGVQMTGELLADFEQWAELTAKLTAHAQQQAPPSPRSPRPLTGQRHSPHRRVAVSLER